MAGKNGGKRPGAGRKPKKDEQALIAMIKLVMGKNGEKELWNKILSQAKEGAAKQQELVVSYLYGKPHQSIAVETESEIQIIIKREESSE